VIALMGHSLGSFMTQYFISEHGETLAAAVLSGSSGSLRKAACRRLAEAGCSANEIAAISGHALLREVERYTKAADQERMARNALARTNNELKTVKLHEV
jgi:pimeloyl-ACP methyl ester carboxylesterase